jgi:ATP-dependent DNA helicase RecQ
MRCRREVLLSYFGEYFEGPCGHCDRCEAGRGEAGAQGPFAQGASVVHERFGSGRVVRYEAGKVVVLFDEIGYQTLALDLVVDEGLLVALEATSDAA